MLTKRIIPCLDIKNGRTVKGVNFVDLKDAGDPVELAKKYAETGADELVFLDISATEERRATLIDLVRKVATAINIPFTVGGGISSVADVDVLLRNGADKISINSSAVKNPDLIKGSRKRRIAAGSGTQIQDVNRLLKQFTQMQKMMKKMSAKGGMQKMMRGMRGMMPPGMKFPGR